MTRRSAKRDATPGAGTDPETSPPAPDSYERYRERQATISRERSAAGREVGPIPAVADQARRERCRLSLRDFCEAYLAERFFWSWSPDHLSVIGLLQSTVLEGGQYVVAMPRGYGKTALCEAAIIWALVYGHRRFIVVIGATADHGEDIVKSVKTEFECNELLLADFPEVCHPIAALDGIANRAKGQTVAGRRTRIVWTDDRVILPTVAGSAASGSLMRAFGLTGAIRGLKHTTPDGRIVRPDLVLLDDPQTDDSAKSPVQNKERMRIISGAVLGLAGRKKKIAALMPTTVICPGDMADEFLTREKHPEWQGQRFKMLYALPTNKDLWDKYAEIRTESQRVGNKGREATEFYAANRAAMDEGAVVAWPECFYEGDLSALQSAMNFLIDNARAFWAEGQNSPLAEELNTGDVRQLSEEDLGRKFNNLARGLVPRECNRLTAFIDVQQEVLFWGVCGWTEKFGGALVEYGAFPPQPRPVFSARDPDVKLSDRFPKLERKARIYAALSELVPQVVGRGFPQDGVGGFATVSLGLIDAGFETEAVHDFISRSPLRAVLKPSMGRGLKADNKPMNKYTRGPGDVVGWNWRIDAQPAGRGRYVMFDANAWKSQVAEALLAPAGASGSFYLPGAAVQQHPLLTVHLLSEYRTLTFSADGRRVEVWKLRPAERENHWLDAVVGCAVAACVSGLTFSAAVAAGQATGDPESKPRADARAEYEKQRRAFEARRGAGR